MPAVDILQLEREKTNKPIRVGMVGAGNMAQTIANQLLTPAPGIRLVAIANRTLAKANAVYSKAGATSTRTVNNAAELTAAINASAFAVTTDPELLCSSDQVDLILEATGTIEFASRVASSAIAHKKHVVLANAELDSTLGPILKKKATAAGVVISNMDGDEPGVAMNLVRYARSIGLSPVAAGNIKGMLDPYRTPETQREFAQKYGQTPAIVCSFADGTKMAMEGVILCNSSGFRVGRRGMYGPKCAHVNEIGAKLPMEQLLSGGLVDFALGAAPNTGAWIVVHEPNPEKRKTLAYLKMGEGPLYVLYTPYHLPHIQIASTIARAALAGDPTTSPIGAPVAEVTTIAKRDLKAGEVLDGVGGFMTYGAIDNADSFFAEDLLAMGLSEGAKLLRDIPKDQAITLKDVELPAGRHCDVLRAEQLAAFPPSKPRAQASAGSAAHSASP
ncbi:MAG TPA: Gfo/Idh/MocA family oxidoreductase [Polyangiaceae bacterium]|nr:Gfo/Idh/MocA family oxidoreductase [Polyangiaceae bacterium]